MRGGTTNRFLLLFSLLYLQTLGGGHDPTGPSASGPPKVKMISEYKRILWQATSSLIIDLSSLAYFFTLAFFFAISDRNFVCYIVHGYIDALLQCLSLRFDKNKRQFILSNLGSKCTLCPSGTLLFSGLPMMI